MAHFLLYQILPLAALWIAFSALGRLPAFGRWGVPAVFAAGAALQFWFWIHSRPDLGNPDSLGFFRLGHGLETDLHGRVLSTTGATIPGLYACGNDMNSVMSGMYPGAGITLGPAIAFGYGAAMHVARGEVA